jgi:hypothetical protein
MLRKGKHEAAGEQTDKVALSDAATRNWRTPPLDCLPAPRLTVATRVWMGVLCGYLLVAVALIACKVVTAALGGGS